MAGELERRILELVKRLLGATIAPTPQWLVRPGQMECGSEWNRVRAIYHDLTAMDLPPIMRPVERRTVDAVLAIDGTQHVFEIDERQHFNAFRATTLRHYIGDVPLAFDTEAWLERSLAKRKLEGGGFAAPKPPLFPGQNGRHRQRAFRDALCDLLPIQYGFAPTLRIADFEVKSWIFGPDAEQRMADFLERRLAGDYSSPVAERT